MSKPDKEFNVALVDADIVAYRTSASAQGLSEGECAVRIDELMNYCVDETVGFQIGGNFKSYLTGSDNFRYTIAKSHPYKGNRSDTVRPDHLKFARAYLQEEWDAIVSEGCEADDLMAIEATVIGDDCVIVSQDKDFNTVPGWKWNFVNGNWRYDTPWSALQYFYSQVLTGDNSDNIKGLYRVGPKTADKMLRECQTEEDLWEVCLKAYDGDLERVVENARLLHL